MTSLRIAKKLKSAVAVIVTGSLVVSTAVMPVAAQSFRAGVSAEAGAGTRAAFTPSTLNGVQPLPGGVLGAANLVPTLAPAIAPTALALPLPAAAKAEDSRDARKPAAAAPAAPVAPVVDKGPAKSDSGPRWVKPAPTPAGPRWVKVDGKKNEGPRWVGAEQTGVRATIARFLPFLKKSGVEAFDGAAARKETLEDSPVASNESRGAANGGLKPAARAAVIINDASIPTPEAARRVGQIRTKQGTPLWAKIVAPVSAIAAVAVAIQFGAIPVLTLAAGLVVSVLAHEIAHLAVLHRLGDHTAEHAGTHSLNPFNHIDAVKTVIVPAISLALSSILLPFPILLGAGKPVDADFNNLRSPFGGPRSARNAFWVAAAGPATNLLIAGAAFGAAALLPGGGAITLVLLGLAKMNLALTVFNLLPLPQLDGGKILASVLPERFCAKWVFNPRVERGYQGVFRRLYEGPSNVLTWLADSMGVRTQKGVNRLANAVTFTALAAFYAAAYFHLAVALPLLFLALPCSYDYWCIREKVRSEAAVQDLMELMSQWSAVIVQIAEDLGLESEVSAYETEHAMKNALETLVDEMMAKEEFRGLSDDQKLESLMKAYPDKAAEYLKDKAMPEDSLEKIKAVLADPRNQFFYDRLRKWFKEHEIFSRWDNKHQQEKLKDAIKAADKEKGKGGGIIEFRESLISRGIAAALRVFSAPAVYGGSGAPDDVMRKVYADTEASADSFVVMFSADAGHTDVARALDGLDYASVAPGEGGRTFRVVLANRSNPHLTARSIAREPLVESVTVNPALYDLMVLPAPAPVGVPAAAAAPSWIAKIKSNNGYPEARVRAVMTTNAAARRLLGELTRPKELKGSFIVETTLTTGPEAAELARALADVADVKAVVVSNTVHRLLVSRNRPSAAAEPVQNELPLAEPEPIPEFTPAAPAAAEPAKLTVEDSLPVNGLKVELAVGSVLADSERIFYLLQAYSGEIGMSGIGVPVTWQSHGSTIPEAERLAIMRRLVDDPAVAAVRAPSALIAALEASSAPESAPNAQGDGDNGAPEAPPAPRAKVSSHGKAEYGLNVVLVKFAADVTDAQKLEILGATALYHHGDMVTLSAASAQKAGEKALALSVLGTVEAVKIHPNVAAVLIGESAPYPNAESFDHDRAVIVEFREGTSLDAVKEYAETRRLTLVHHNFRGSQRAYLFTVPAAGAMRATLQMLVDETPAAGSLAEAVRPFQEQPGEAELKPSEKALKEAVVEAQPEPAAPRRDPALAWQDYLQNTTLSDGKSKLTDKQVQLLTVMLKPLARQPEEKRPPIVGRGEEIKRLLPIVTSPRGMRNSVILVGEAGVGKTAVPEGLAEMIEDAEHAAALDGQAFLQFERLKGRWLVELDINKVLTQEDPVGVLAAILDLLPRLNKGAPSRGNDIIVLMDEIQKFFLDNAGQKIANTLKGPLRDGKISVIATTTRSEFKKFIEGDDAFRRRFEKIDVEEPTVPQTISILRAMKSWLQSLHEAAIPDQALVDAAKLSDQFDKTNFNPDKAIKAVQDAAELSRPDNLRAAITLDLRETWGELVVAANEARQALIDKGIASVLALPVDHYNKIAWLVQKAEALYAEREAVAEGKGQVTTDVVKRVIAAKTGIASGQLNLGEDDAGRYTQMEASIGARVVNQDRALTAIANAVRRNKAGLSNPNRPMGKFLLTGPTGVGKTYLAKELARFLFNDPEAMVRMDMSEYMEEHTAQRLTGSPPGYVGYGEGGQLTEAVRKKPYSVILFDEVEKAHPKVFDVLLQILDDGRLTDGQGRTVDFKNTVIIMTSNSGMKGVDGEKYAAMLAKIEAHNAAVAAGKALETDGKPLPTVAEVNQLWDEEIDLMVGAALKERFRPEFLNRLDEDPLSKNKWIRVNRLRPEDIAKIAKIQLKEFETLLADRHDTDIVFDATVVDFLAAEGYSPLYGARPMTAAIEKHIIDPLAQWILSEAEAGRKDVRGALINVRYDGGKILFDASRKPDKNTARATVKGASEAVAAEVFSMIERLSGGESAEEPAENLFDQLMRKARPAAEKGTAAALNGKEAGTRTSAFFALGAGINVGGTATVAEHNNSKKKDGSVRSSIAALAADAAAAGWGPEVLAALEPGAGQVGEGWLKQIAKLSKEHAAKAAVAAPIAISAAVSGDVIQVAVAGAYALSDDDQKALVMHFSGTPPASYLEAQQKADNLNLSARLLWDHNLLDLYRRLSAIPGARMGFKTGAEGTQIWLEIKKTRTPPALSAAAPAAAKADVPSGTPHQVREMIKARDLMMGVIDQSKLKDHERDGHSIRIAAAEGYATLAQPSDAAKAREWIVSKMWAADVVDEKAANMYSSAEPKVQVGSDWPLAMTAALVLEKFGTPTDIPLLENMARRVLGTGHTEVPVHQALEQALAALYVKAGLAETRAALRRAAQLTAGRTQDITGAAKRALGTVGMPADLDEAKNDAEGFLAMTKRLGRQDELQAMFRDNKAWAKGFMGASNDVARQAALKLAGETESSPEALNHLKNLMKVETGYSRTAFEMSRAWAAIVAREGLTQGLGAALKTYLDARGVENYSHGSTWTVLYSYVLAAAAAGGADALAPLEQLMSYAPGGIASVNEQAYFNSPDAWARVLVRSGKFDEYARSQGLNADGSPKPSKLQEMLTNKSLPMMTAAALRAITYARDPLFRSRAVAPKGALPDIQPDSPVAPTPSPRGPSNPRFGGYGGYGGMY